MNHHTSWFGLFLWLVFEFIDPFFRIVQSIFNLFWFQISYMFFLEFVFGSFFKRDFIFLLKSPYLASLYFFLHVLL
jgi:hypothetical protein